MFLCWRMKDQLDVTCYFISLLTFSTFRTLIYPSSGACDCVLELPRRSSCSQFVVCWRFGAAGFEWCSCCRLKHKLLMMDILMSETCWAHKKWNKIASDIKLVFHSSTITMMHGPINISCFCLLICAHLHWSWSYSDTCFTFLCRYPPSAISRICSTVSTVSYVTVDTARKFVVMCIVIVRVGEWYCNDGVFRTERPKYSEFSR